MDEIPKDLPDFSGRFRKPGDPPAPAPSPASAPPPPPAGLPASPASKAALAPSRPPAPAAPSPGSSDPYGLAQLLADSLSAPLQPIQTFSRLAAREAPGFGTMAANLMLAWAASFALNAAHAAIAYPKDFARYAGVQILLVGALALAFALLASFAAAAVLHVAALIVGGKGGYARSLQTVSTLAALVPIAAALSWFPGTWALAPAAGLFLTVVAVEKLHGSSPWATRVVFVGCASALLGGGWLAKRAIEAKLAPYMAIGGGLQELQRAAQAAAAGAPAPGAELMTPGAPIDPEKAAEAAAKMIERIQLAIPSSQPGAAPAGDSSLDMIATPEPGSGMPAGPPVSPQQMQAITNAGAGMIGSLMPLLNNPAMTKNMSPEQRKQMQEFTKMMEKMQSGMQSGKPMDPKEMARLQSTMLQMMGSMGRPPTGRADAAPADEGRPK